MAFVLVQHLAPDHKSLLAELIRRYTRMQVLEVEDGMRVRPNCAYIIPPNRDMAFFRGTLQLLEPSAPRGQRMPIDFFFRSLAQDQRERAIGIILSGTGSDGTHGVRDIKGEGGMIMVQRPATTEYDGMPRSALATGMVDFELPPAEMPAHLIAYVSHALGRLSRPAALAPKMETTLEKIFVLLRTQIGHDFSLYKPSTVLRRIERRMAVHQIESMEEYVRFAQQSSEEVEILFRDLLIGVTHFFRDAAAFKALEQEVIPRLFAGRPANSPIRIWSVGCSTGEEAYSLAILLAEHQAAIRQRFQVQVFATDIDSQAIALARTGVYPASIASDVSAERLDRFFTPEPDQTAFRIHKSIRDMLIFSEQNVVRDPPFSKLDLISCRNLLIYMGPELQKKVIRLFHYALNPGGFLFLGNSETVGEFMTLFKAFERKQKLYQRKEAASGGSREDIGGSVSSLLPSEGGLGPTTERALAAKKSSVRELAEQALLQEVVQTALLVNAQGDILYQHGRSGMYLEPAPGESAPNNILKMAREGLRRDLTTALHKVVQSREGVHREGLRVQSNSDSIVVNLRIRPVAGGPEAVGQSTLYLIVLEHESAGSQVLEAAGRRRKPGSPRTPREGTSAEAGVVTDADSHIEALKQDLLAKEEYLKAANEELETSNEELKSSNEEMQSVNEELQSSNEELETSKEELQSVNEELATVNAELQTKVADLSRANNDMNNLLAGTGIATVFVDHQLRILRFTPAATKIINLILGDIGRPLAHIVPNLLGYDSLISDTKGVLDTLVPKEVEVRTNEGRWYAMRIQPYRTLDNVIEGAVLTFVDITAVRKLHETLLLNEERLRVALSACPIVLSNQDLELRYTWVYRSTNRPLPLQPADRSKQEGLGKTDAELFPKEEAAQLTLLKRKVLNSGEGLRQIIHRNRDGEVVVQDLTIEPLRDTDGSMVGITCASLDVTGRQVPDQEPGSNANALPQERAGDP